MVKDRKTRGKGKRGFKHMMGRGIEDKVSENRSIFLKHSLMTTK